MRRWPAPCGDPHQGERETIRSVAIRQSDGDRSLLTIGAELTP